jgi:hypothetical protein
VRRERDLTRRHPLARAYDRADSLANVVERHLERLERTGREPLFLAEQTEQQMLGADVVVSERARFFLRQDDDLAPTLGEALERLTPP